jgi:hypothetical protein
MEGEIDELQGQLQKVMDGAVRRHFLGDGT